MEHTAGFLKLVNETRRQVHEISVAEARALLGRDPKVVLMDVREDSEWANGHAIEAVHLGKGVLERDIERMYPDKNTEIIMYCGGGYRSVLTCEVAQRMGYKRVHSIVGGYRAMLAANWPMTQG